MFYALVALVTPFAAFGSWALWFRGQCELSVKEADLRADSAEDREEALFREVWSLKRELEREREKLAKIRVVDPDAGFRSPGSRSACEVCRRDCVHCANEKSRQERKDRQRKRGARIR